MKRVKRVLHGKLFRLARCFRIHDKWHRKVHDRVRVSPLSSFEREKPHRAAVLNVTRMEWERRENLPCNNTRLTREGCEVIMELEVVTYTV